MLLGPSADQGNGMCPRHPFAVLAASWGSEVWAPAQGWLLWAHRPGMLGCPRPESPHGVSAVCGELSLSLPSPANPGWRLRALLPGVEEASGIRASFCRFQADTERASDPLTPGALPGPTAPELRPCGLALALMALVPAGRLE